MSAHDNLPDATAEGQNIIEPQDRYNTLLQELRAILDDPDSGVQRYEVRKTRVTAHG